jgi:lysophospholipase L1-like esterase
MKRLLFAAALLMSMLSQAKAEVDPQFHIYLCFGQSNMEGNAQWETIDNQYVDPRFQMLATTAFDSPKRTMGQWYTAYCPIVSPMGKLGMSDYFGRTMVAAMPSDVKIGVVAVAMGGAPIEMFDKDKYQAKINEDPSAWHVTLANWYYGGNPYKRLIDMAKKAQEVGVIKGILLHQGESNNTQQDWPQKVKKIYNDILSDLGLQAEDVPLFAGETEYQEMGGVCWGHNAVIARLPQVIPTAHVVSAKGCPGNGQDGFHFSPTGYRMMGKRYAFEALRVMGKALKVDASYTLPDNLKKFFTAKSLQNVGDLVMRKGSSRSVSITATFEDGHQEDVSNEITYSVPDFVTEEGGRFTAIEEGTGTITATYTDFTGKSLSVTFQVESTMQGTNHILVVNNGSAGQNAWDKQCNTTLKKAMVKGKNYVVKALIKADKSGDCALWPIWTGSSNKNQWGGSNDVQYLSSYRLTSTFKEYTWSFNAQFPNDKLQFAFGLIGGKVYFDDVSCKEKDSDEEMVVNGDFESDDLSNWEIISWAGQTMTIEEDNTTGIRTVNHEMVSTDKGLYDLSGRHVSGAHPHKGVYISNGKKIILR